MTGLCLISLENEDAIPLISVLFFVSNVHNESEKMENFWSILDGCHDSYSQRFDFLRICWWLGFGAIVSDRFPNWTAPTGAPSSRTASPTRAPSWCTRASATSTSPRGTCRPTSDDSAWTVLISGTPWLTRSPCLFVFPFYAERNGTANIWLLAITFYSIMITPCTIDYLINRREEARFQRARKLM